MCKLFIQADPALWETVTRPMRIHGLVTSIRLERFFWLTLEELAEEQQETLSGLCAQLNYEYIEAGYDLHNFTSFLRVCCGRYLALKLDKEQNPQRIAGTLPAH